MKKILIIIISLLVLIILFLGIIYKGILDDMNNINLKFKKIKNLSEERIYIITDIIDLSVKEEGESDILDNIANNRDKLHESITSNNINNIYKYNNELSSSLTNLSSSDTYNEMLTKNDKILKSIEKAYDKYNKKVLSYNKSIKEFPRNIFKLKKKELIK